MMANMRLSANAGTQGLSADERRLHANAGTHGLAGVVQPMVSNCPTGECERMNTWVARRSTQERLVSADYQVVFG